MGFHVYSQKQTIFLIWLENNKPQKEKASNLICKSLLRLGSYFAHDNITKQWLPLTVYQIEFSSLTMKGKHPPPVDTINSEYIVRQKAIIDMEMH